MAIVVSDSFTGSDGTELFSYNSVWDNHPSFSPDLVISNANRCRTTGSSGTARCYRMATDPGADAYDVYCNIRFVTYDTATGQAIGPAGRIDTSANTMYFARHNPVAGQWQLFKTVAGVSTSLGTYSQTFSAGDEPLAKLTLRTSGNTVELLVDGVSRITSTDTAITARGLGGIREGSGQPGGNSVQVHVDNFVIENALTTGQPIAKRYDTLRQSRGLNWGIGIG